MKRFLFYFKKKVFEKFRISDHLTPKRRFEILTPLFRPKTGSFSNPKIWLFFFRKSPVKVGIVVRLSWNFFSNLNMMYYLLLQICFEKKFRDMLFRHQKLKIFWKKIQKTMKNSEKNIAFWCQVVRNPKFFEKLFFS